MKLQTHTCLSTRIRNNVTNIVSLIEQPKSAISSMNLLIINNAADLCEERDASLCSKKRTQSEKTLSANCLFSTDDRTNAFLVTYDDLSQRLFLCVPFR